jgi:hypothetical protein
MADKAWKRLERTVGRLFGGERVKRMGDYSVSATDVVLDDLKNFRIDCKLRQKFMHHAMFDEIKKKYCKADDDVPVMVTKEHGKYRYLVSVEAEFFAEMLQAYREKRRAHSALGVRVIKSRIAARGSLPS